MTIHAKYSPSTLGMLHLCHGFKNGEGSVASERGTLLHEHIADCVKAGFKLPEDADQSVEFAITVALNELNGVDLSTAKILVETKVNEDLPDRYGFADLIVAVGDTAWLFDWKSGFGRKIQSEQSAQIYAYAQAVFFIDGFHEVKTVKCIMVNIDKKTVSRGEVKSTEIETIETGIQSLIAASYNSDWETRNPGPMQCGFCGRKAECEKLHDFTRKTLAAINGSSPVDEVNVAGKLNELIPAFEIAEKYIEALKEKAKSELDAGNSVEGWTLKDRGGARKWTLERDDVIASVAKSIESATGVPYDATKLLTVNSVSATEKLMVDAGVKKGKAKEVLERLSSQTATKVLKRIDDGV